MNFDEIIKELPKEVQIAATSGLVRIFLLKSDHSRLIVLGQSGAMVRVSSGVQEHLSSDPDWNDYEELNIPVIKDVGKKKRPA